MPNIIVWALFAILQVQGGVGGAFNTKEECEEQRAEVMQKEEAIAVSACTQVILEPKGK